MPRICVFYRWPPAVPCSVWQPIHSLLCGLSSPTINRHSLCLKREYRQIHMLRDRKNCREHINVGKHWTLHQFTLIRTFIFNHYSHNYVTQKQIYMNIYYFIMLHKNWWSKYNTLLLPSAPSPTLLVEIVTSLPYIGWLLHVSDPVSVTCCVVIDWRAISWLPVSPSPLILCQ